MWRPEAVENLKFRNILIIWAPSSEFVSSSIPSWQTLTAHAQPFRVARYLAFSLKVPLDSLLVWASSEGSGETARMRRLTWTFAARIGDKYQIRLTRSNSVTWHSFQDCPDSRRSRLKMIWRGKNISLSSKVKLMRMLILSAFLYACESWTLTTELERRIQHLEMRCYWRLLNISFKDHNGERGGSWQHPGCIFKLHEDFLIMLKKRELRWYVHIARPSGHDEDHSIGDSEKARRRGRQKKRWEDNIKEKTGTGFEDSLMAAEKKSNEPAHEIMVLIT